MGGFVPGTSGTAANSQCSIAASGSAVSGSGNQLTVTVSVTFQAYSGGAQNNYLIAYDQAGLNSGWQQVGTWTNPLPNFTLATAQDTYSMVTGSATPAYTLTVTPINGFSGPVGFNITPFYGCGNATFNPPSVAGPPWTTTLTMPCNEPFTNTYVTTVQAYGGGMSRTLPLYLRVTATQQYSLTTAVGASGGGTILPASDWYNSGTPVTITATPYGGYQFSGFTGTVNSSSNPLTVTMKSAMTETANFVPASSQYTATTVADLNNCIQNLTQYTTCALAAGTHVLTQPIVVTRSNVTIAGEYSDRSQTVLARGRDFTCPMMLIGDSPSDHSPSSCTTQWVPYRLDQPSPAPTTSGLTPGTTKYTNITIRDLTFCGGSILSRTPGSPCYPYQQTETTCGSWTNQHTMWHKSEDDPTRPPDPPNHLPQCVDLLITSADTGQRPPDPFTYAGPYSVTVSNSAFEDSTGHAVALYPAAPQEVNDVFITGSAINSSEVTGLLVGVNGENYDDPRTCDNNPNFRNDASVHAPRNIRVEGSTFKNNLTGAFGINAARWFALRNNKAPSAGFENNYINPQVGNVEGGTVFFNHCTDTVRIYDNGFVRGTSAYPQTAGMELWGRNIDVRRNEVSGYPTEGIGANSVYHLTAIDHNETVDNNTHPAGQRGGILVWTSGSGGGCDPTPRDTDDVEISGGNTSTGNAYGILLGDCGESRNTMKNVRITDDNILQTPAVGLNTIVTLSGNINIAPATTPVTSDPAPRALEIGPRCSTPGTRQTFTFSVADVDMPGNIRFIEGAFSVPGRDSDGAGGPDKPACHFLYFYNVPDDPSLNNKLYLDDPNTLYTWPLSSFLGSGGSDLVNSFCTIRAASSGATMESKILKLTLDVQFSSHLDQKKHMYLVALDNDGLSSHDGKWKYSGWWSTQ